MALGEYSGTFTILISSSSAASRSIWSVPAERVAMIPTSNSFSFFRTSLSALSEENRLIALHPFSLLDGFGIQGLPGPNQFVALCVRLLNVLFLKSVTAIYCYFHPVYI